MLSKMASLYPVKTQSANPKHGDTRTRSSSIPQMPVVWRYSISQDSSCRGLLLVLSEVDWVSDIPKYIGCPHTGLVSNTRVRITRISSFRIKNKAFHEQFYANTPCHASSSISALNCTNLNKHVYTCSTDLNDVVFTKIVKRCQDSSCLNHQVNKVISGGV